jgi:uncharacterized LabA/DUF88 family protein
VEEPVVEDIVLSEGVLPEEEPAVAAVEPEPAAVMPPSPSSAIAEIFDALPPLAEDWSAAPASEAELAAIAAATGRARPPLGVAPSSVPGLPAADDLDVEDESTEGLAPSRRRRRRGRGRRGGAGRGIAPGEVLPGEDSIANGHAALEAPVAPTSAELGGVVPQPAQTERRAMAFRQPILPPYPVEFEPLPPPTKRKPARRPGTAAEPRFSRDEIKEFEQFVRTGPPAAEKAASESTGRDELRASLLTAEEERALATPPARRPRRSPSPKTGAPQTASADTALTPTPAFLPMPTTPVNRAGASPIEALLARQNVIIDTLMERQISLLRNIERSLIALDRKLGTLGTGAGNMPRAGVFVDVPNVIYAAERIGVSIDFKKLLDFLVTSRGRELVRANAYAPVSDDPQMRLESQKFVQPFVGRGYRIVTKPLKRFADGTMKGNFDVELAMDVLTMADRLDVVCLVSGDGDFRRLVEMITSRGVRVEAIAFSSSTSMELRASCDEYIDLGLHLRDVTS